MTIERKISDFARLSIFKTILIRLNGGKIGNNNKTVSIGVSYIKDKIYEYSWKYGVSRRNIKTFFSDMSTILQLIQEISEELKTSISIEHIDDFVERIGDQNISRGTVYYIFFSNIFNNKPITKERINKINDILNKKIEGIKYLYNVKGEL